MATPLKDPAHSENEIRIIMERSQSSGLISFRRLLLMENVFDMGTLKVRDAMKSPRSVKVLQKEALWSENLALIRDSKYSRFPLVAAGEGLPLGIVHVKDVLHLELNKQKSPDLTAVMRPYLKVSEEMPLESLLTELQRHRRRVAIVADAKGQWVGHITLEDVVEEIIGSVVDEFEKEHPVFLVDTMSVGRIVFDVRAADMFGAIRNILARVDAAELPLAREKIERAVIEREKDISTYLGHGVAVPHARFEGLERPVLVFAQSAEGVPLAGSSEHVHIFFVLLTPLSAPQFQVRLLARICGLMQSEYVVEQLRETRDANRLLELVRAADPGTIG
jgi:tellurite resistance protein TerC